MANKRRTLGGALAVALVLLLPVAFASQSVAPTTIVSVPAASTVLRSVPAAVSPDKAPATVARPLQIPKSSPDTRLVVVRAKPGRAISHLVGDTRPVNGNYVLEVPPGKTTEEYAAELSRTGELAYATPDRVSYPLDYTSTPNDPDFTNRTQYSIAADGTYVPYAKSWWATGREGSGNAASPDFAAIWPYLAVDGNAYHARATASQVKVGVIDTGFYFNILDAGSNIVAGKDEFQSYSHGVYVTDNDVTPNPLGSSADHGTMVASEISQATNNNTGGAGASYDTQVRVYKVQGTWVDGSAANQVIMLNSAITNAIYDATNDGCRVISMSLGGDYNDPQMQAAIDYAYAAGVVIVAATGNASAAKVLYPGAGNHVIGAGSYSLTANGQGTPVRTGFSNWGAGLDILAPGDRIWGPSETTPGSPSYAWWSGTSMATPLVAAAAATTIRFVPDLGPDEVAAVLYASARDIGAAGYDTTNGWGCLDMEAAYAKLKTDYPNLTGPTISGTAANSFYDRREVDLSWSRVAGYQVSYGVSVDGATPVKNTTLDVSLTGLADGTHTVTVTPSSPRNWAEGSAVTVTFTVDTVAPIAPVVTWNASARQVSWTTPETGGTTQFALDSTANPATVSGSLATLPAGTPDGPHAAYVRITDATGRAGAWGSVAFVLDTTPPAAPVLSWNAATKTLSWTDNENGARTTQLAIDSKASPLSVSGTSHKVTPTTADGPHTAYVRLTDAAGNTGAWGSLAFMLDTTPPATSAVSWDWATKTLSWTDTEAGVHSTQLGLDSQSSPLTVSGTTWVPPEGTSYGGHTAWIRMTDSAGNVGGWNSTAFTLIDPADIHAAVLAFTSSQKLTLAHAAQARLSGTLAGTDGIVVAGADVVLQASVDGGQAWSTILTATTDDSGRWSASFAPSRSELVRTTWTGDATHTAGVSGTAVSVSQRAYLSTPITPGRVTHRRSFTTYVYLKPRFTSGTSPVRLYFYRLEKQRNRTYKWVLRKTVAARAANYSTYTKCSVSASVPYAGKWKATAKYAGSAIYAATTSGNRYFTAR